MEQDQSAIGRQCEAAAAAVKLARRGQFGRARLLLSLTITIEPLHTTFATLIDAIEVNAEVVDIGTRMRLLAEQRETVWCGANLPAPVPNVSLFGKWYDNVDLGLWQAIAGFLERTYGYVSREAAYITAHAPHMLQYGLPRMEEDALRAWWSGAGGDLHAEQQRRLESIRRALCVTEPVKNGTMVVREETAEDLAILHLLYFSDVMHIDDGANLSPVERALKAAVLLGKTVIANIRTDGALIRWAESQGVFVRADRKTKWGNPFHLDRDGTRDEVCDKYQAYLWKRRDLLQGVGSLRGKVLGCWCRPARCHCRELQLLANRG